MSQRFSVQSSKNSLPISASELVERYFFGIPIKDPSGNVMSEKSLSFYIKAASEQVEGYLNLKLTRQIIEETLSYNFNDYYSWGFIPTSFPVLQAHSLVGYIGSIQQVIYPPEWLSVKRTNDPTGQHRAVYLVPSVGTVGHNSVVYNGISPVVGWFGQQTIPNYWTLVYCTSFKETPSDILDFIGKLAAINVFYQLGDIILGPGIASQSIGIDGLSQSIGTTLSASKSGYGARVTSYIEDLKVSKDLLKNKYDGMVLGIL